MWKLSLGANYSQKQAKQSCDFARSSKALLGGKNWKWKSQNWYFSHSENHYFTCLYDTRSAKTQLGAEFYALSNGYHIKYHFWAKNHAILNKSTPCSPFCVFILIFSVLYNLKTRRSVNYFFSTNQIAGIYGGEKIYSNKKIWLLVYGFKRSDRKRWWNINIVDFCHLPVSWNFFISKFTL